MKQQLLNHFNVVRHVLSLIVVILLPLGVWAQTDYGITIAGVAVTSENASGVTGDNITGTVTYSADDNSLTLSGATIAGNIVITSGSALNIKVSGQNVINAGEASAIQSQVATTSPTLSFTKVGTGDCSLELNSEDVTAISTGFDNQFTYYNLAMVTDGDEDIRYNQEYGLHYYAGNDEYLPITAATITSYEMYDIIVNGETVTSLNKDGICKGVVGAGHILFDGDHTLTLNNVPNMVFDGSYPFIQTSMDLTISIVGVSYFDCGQSVFITRMEGDTETHTVTFTTDATNPGMLTLQVGNQFNGFDKAFENGLTWKPTGYYDPTDQNRPVAWVAPPFLGGGEGTEGSPYLIKTVNDLKVFANSVYDGIITTEYVKLDNDIDCSTMTGFIPIGSNNPFVGTFDGSNKTISGLSYSTNNTNSIVGLFAKVGTEGGPTGTIKNLVLEDCSFSGGYICGGIVGLMNSGTLENCKVTGNSTISAVGDGAVAGAIIGNYSGGALTGNYYYYSVTTSTQGPNDAEAIVRSGHDERGLGNDEDITDDGGAVLYTKQLTVTGLGENCAHEGDPGYGPLADYDNFIFHYAPGATTMLYLYPSGDLIPSVTLSYTEPGKTEPTVVTLEKDPDYEGYLYPFTMPDVDATFAITLTNSYNLWIGTTQVTEGNADDVLGDGGTVKFTSTDGQAAAPVYTLTLNGATITGPIKVGLDNLTFDVQGTNTVTANGSCVILSELEGSSLTFKSTSDGESNLTMTNADKDSYDGVFSAGFGYNIDKTLALVQPNTTYYFTDGSYHTVHFASAYGVGISDGGGGVIQVYSGNADDVLGDGKVSFNKENHTLTLNNATVGGISTSLSALDIDVIGNNSIAMSGNGAVFQNPYGVDNIQITVKSTAETTGCMSMYLSSNDNSNSGGTSGFLDTNVTLAYSNGLTLVSGDLTDTYQAYAMIAEPVDYDLYVDNIKVVAANASNITNGLNNNGNPYASFDLETNTLTLDNISTSYYWSNNILVQSDIQDLTIKLVGNNMVTLGNTKYAVGFIGKAPNTTPTLTFDSEAENNQYGSLTITGATSQDAIAHGYQITNTLTDNTEESGLVCTIGDNYVKLWSQETYGLVVVKDDVSYSINNANCSDVLGDGTDAKPASVQYDGRSRLVLNNADLTSITIGSTNALPASGLEIYLEGNSTIDNSGAENGYAISSEGADAAVKLTFITGSDKPGTLVCTNNKPIGENNPFSGFNVTYKDNLAGMPDGNTLSVQMPMGLIIDVIGTPTTLDYSTSSPAGDNNIALDNDICNKVLYTLNDDGTAGTQENPNDGYDQIKKCIVINSVMTDEAVRAIDTDVTVPGTPAYASVFKGMTFIVPAGTGTITLMNVTTSAGYAFHVMVGKQDPMEVVNTSGTPADFELDYACSEASYVKVYLVATSTAAPALDSHRAGPKASISGGIGGMKVSASTISPAPDAGAAYYQMGKGDWERKAGTKGIVVNNADVTDLPDNAFDISSAPGLNRAPATDEITFIDLTATKVTGKSYDRTTGAFAGIPASTLIYLPAGNTATGKNFVIGGICEDMQLDGTSDNTFEVNKKFTASQATFERDFEAGENKCYTVYLPYSIDAEKVKGNFFEYDGFDAEKQVVKMKAATGMLAANKAYIFSPSTTGGIGSVNCVEVEVPETGIAKPADDAEAEGLHGVYEYHQWTSAPSNIYCYAAADKGDIKAGQFGKVGAGEDIKPFCAYLRINSATKPSSVVIDWGNGTTSIVPLDKQQVEQGADGWYTITGLRLPEKPSQKGVYIHQGKKVAVK